MDFLRKISTLLIGQSSLTKDRAHSARADNVILPTYELSSFSSQSTGLHASASPGANKCAMFSQSFPNPGVPAVCAARHSDSNLDGIIAVQGKGSIACLVRLRANHLHLRVVN